MKNLLDNKRRTQILGSFEIQKAYTEGIYADTPANRKLGRVGMTYTEYANKMANKEISQEKEEDFNFVGAEYNIYDVYPKPSYIKEAYMKRIPAGDSKSGRVEYQGVLKIDKNNKEEISERFFNKSEIKNWFKNKFKETKSSSKEDKKEEDKSLFHNEQKLNESLSKISELEKQKGDFKEDKDVLELLNNDIQKEKDKIEKICPNYNRAYKYANQILDTDDSNRGKEINVPKDCVESIKFLLKFEGLSSSEYKLNKTEKGYYISLI